MQTNDQLSSMQQVTDNHAILARRDWWRPIWRSQLFDSGADHREKLGSAIWLYLFLLIHVDYRTGIITRSLGQLATELCAPKKTTRDWLTRLRKMSYVSAKREGTLFHIRVIHFRMVSWQQRDRYSTLWRPKSDAAAPKSGRPIN